MNHIQCDNPVWTHITSHHHHLPKSHEHFPPIFHEFYRISTIFKTNLHTRCTEIAHSKPSHQGDSTEGTLASASIKACTAPNWPLLAATCSGVTPWWSARPRLAAVSNKAFFGKRCELEETVWGWNKRYTPRKLRWFTWKGWFPKGISFSRGPFSGSMLVFGGAFRDEHVYFYKDTHFFLK